MSENVYNHGNDLKGSTYRTMYNKTEDNGKKKSYFTMNDFVVGFFRVHMKPSHGETMSKFYNTCKRMVIF